MSQHTDDTHYDKKYQRDEFPNKLGPFGIQRTSYSATHFSTLFVHPKDDGFYQLDPLRIFKERDPALTTLKEFLQFVVKNGDSSTNEYGVIGQISPVYAVTLDSHAKKKAGIPENSTKFAWMYPGTLPTSELAVHPRMATAWMGDCNISILTVGGYAYFNDEDKLLAVNALTPAKNGGLQFSPPKKWDASFTKKLYRKGRFQEITLAALSDKGASRFAWLFPNEELTNDRNETRKFCAHGGFVYLFHDIDDSSPEKVARDCYFEVLSGSDYRDNGDNDGLLLKP
ncbi:hypothetical protein RFI_10861 [Reticulomyxa filosa]|uniref:Uncharacterized protein n=1 Tax=Reticulomyxa filosa TaxID=46433 RepID=X6NK41_RETFI|nr:hypothetical protein RFI_10861 [Reticulomyxa filosa]|eukprot:ETO26278.1 hypothetical protein RFI_10861 [Reticulomyxa filosa]